MSKTQFLLHKMFQETHKVTLSDAEIAKRCGISMEYVRDYIERDIEAGMLFENRANSTYYLTFLGLDVLQKKRPAFWASLLGTMSKL